MLGLLIGPVGFYLRRHLDDTLPHAAAGAPRERARIPWRQVVAGTLLVIGGTSTTYTIVFFLPSFLTLTVGMPASVSLLSGCAAGVVLLIGSPLAGRLADRVRRRKRLVGVTCVASAVLVLPAFYAMSVWPSVVTAVAVVIVLIGLMTLSSPAGFVMILDAFRPEVRAMSLGMIYALGVTIFGGFAQLIVGAMWRATGSFYAPAWYVLGCSAASLVGLALFVDTPAVDGRR